MFKLSTHGGSVVEFYITNVCNLSCTNCNRFNNYKFKGHYSWQDSEYALTEWSKRIELEHLTIIGGEPTLNPDLEYWCYGLRKLWPNAEIRIATNGQYLSPSIAPDRLWEIYQVGYGVTSHNDETHRIAEEVHEGRAVVVKNYMFRESAVVQTETGLTVHNSNPQDAFDKCDMKYCHHMINGKLYKCGVVAVLPEFEKQHSLQLTEHQRHLLTSYKPLSHDCTDKELEDFLSTVNSPIPQCALCPASAEYKLIDKV